jgi:hypothetical protein
MNDRELLEDVASWPRSGDWRVCCVKNYTGYEHRGFPPMENFGMFVSTDGQTISSAPGNPHPNGISIIREDHPPIHFANLQEALDAGWLVD